MPEDGCEYGHINRLRIDVVEKCQEGILEKLDAINRNLFAGVVLVIILAFLAGINIWQEILRLVK